MVLDDYQEGIPVEWTLSNREDKPVLVHILQAREGLVGPSSHPGGHVCHGTTVVNDGKKCLDKIIQQLWCVWYVNRA